MIAETSSAARSQWRKALSTAGLSSAQVSAILPRGSAGRPKGQGRPFPGLSAAARGAVSEALGLDEFPTSLAGWSPESVDAAASAIVEHYENHNSAASALTSYRNGLRGIGAPVSLLDVSQRPELSAIRNLEGDHRTAERAAEGLEPPEPFRTIRGLLERVTDYIAQGATWIPDGQAAADLLVTLSARPGEAETLKIGERGGVTGVLKKKTAGESYPIVSALGADNARALLSAWKRAPAKTRGRAMRELQTLTRLWGIQRRDLRAIGAHLAGRAAQISGGAMNPTQLRSTVIGALRHAPITCAVEHYTRVNDPTPSLSAKFAEMSPEKQAQVLALFD